MSGAAGGGGAGVGGGVQRDFPKIEAEKGKCRQFLRNNIDQSDNGNVYNKYTEQLQEIADRQIKVLEICLDDIIEQMGDEEFVTNIRNNTTRYISYFEEIADEMLPVPRVVHHERDVVDFLQNQREVANSAAPGGEQGAQLQQSDLPKRLTRRFEVNIVPPQAERPVKIREILANDIGRLVKLKGMVTRATDVKPRVSVCTYSCDVCGSEIYQEVVGNAFAPIGNCPSQRCIDNKTTGRVTQQNRGTKFVKYQELRLQELPDQVPVGHIPRAITIHCVGEMTRKCGPGDIVTVSGIFLTQRYPGYRGITAGLQHSTYVEAMSIEKQKLAYGDIATDTSTAAVVAEISQDQDTYNRLSQSIAPEIYGHEDVKKALLLQLIGGVTRVLPDGMKIRGDINILAMGDPGVAKSQLLKYIATVSPRGVYTTGKGSSGVGLTAAVVRDPLTGDMTLEGGALVLADMGICCIDEFDKMDESDRTAIHEVMEQQTISIAKAGITTTLNARAAVLAAANPLYGRYNRRKSISENVDLPNSLLSRFDLLFLILDKCENENDMALSKHVLHVHKYLRNPDVGFTPIKPSAMKQFIAHARTFTPTVPEDLTSYIVEAFVALRSQDGEGRGRGTDQAVMTARQLLSILRLSQALARLRLADKITHQDVDEAIRLTHSSKASLQEERHAGSAKQDDVLSQIYSMIRDAVNQQPGSRSVKYADMETMVVKRGFSVQALQDCIREYQGLAIWTMDSNGTHITFNDEQM